MRTLAVAVAALLGPVAVHAQPVSSLGGPGPDTYLQLHLGGFLPQHDDVEALDPGYAFGGTFGARFSPYVGVEAGLEYLRATGEDAGVRVRLSDVPITVSLRLRAPLKVAELAVIGGAGLHVTSFSAEPATGPGISDTSTSFGVHLGAAAAFNLSPMMLVGVDARRTFLEPKFDGERVRVDGLRIALTLTYHF